MASFNDHLEYNQIRVVLALMPHFKKETIDIQTWPGVEGCTVRLRLDDYQRLMFRAMQEHYTLMEKDDEATVETLYDLLEQRTTTLVPNMEMNNSKEFTDVLLQNNLLFVDIKIESRAIKSSLVTSILVLFCSDNKYYLINKK
jgi:hypothetical protein